jgi:5-methylthioribose kinase
MAADGTDRGGYRPLDAAGVIAALAAVPAVAARLGGGPERWRAGPLAGGNLNLMHLVEGPAGAVCAKQALPYMRMLGEAAPMPLSRIRFEHMALTAHARHAPERVPEVLHFDERLALMVQARLAPHIELRRGLIARQVFPRLAEQLADYLARTLFFSSDLALPAAERRAAAAEFAGNAGMFQFLDDLAYTEPYMDHPRNRWNRPHLDRVAALLRSDDQLRLKVGRLKHADMTRGEALAHGDLHTGSVMVTADDTRVIDFELAGYLPLGTDIGVLLGHLFMSFFAQDGHADREGSRADYKRWLLATIEGIWTGFAARFGELWRSERRGEAWPAGVFDRPELADAACAGLVADIFRQALSVAGIEAIRRIINLGQVDDFELIADPAERAVHERACVLFARALILGADRFAGIEAVTAAAAAMQAPGTMTGA